MIKPMTGPEFRTWRFQRGLNAAEIGAMLGVDRTTIWRWENGDIRHPVLLRLAVMTLDRFV
jgi:transcriptional regulator with XRE-family HTH domain